MSIIKFNETIKLMVGDNIISTLPYAFSQRDCARIMIVCDEPAYRLGYVYTTSIGVFINTLLIIST